MLLLPNILVLKELLVYCRQCSVCGSEHSIGRFAFCILETDEWISVEFCIGVFTNLFGK
jgi:hypothetical protein